MDNFSIPSADLIGVNMTQFPTFINTFPFEAWKNGVKYFISWDWKHGYEQ